jgi:hypothetical protein
VGKRSYSLLGLVCAMPMQAGNQGPTRGTQASTPACLQLPEAVQSVPPPQQAAAPHAIAILAVAMLPPFP